ncbi:beta-1,3-galactosyl-O-glycosyl-glycoprotein beta-1,6-N-acetylglucosaminyltransferase [Biomphalaria glabrata]|nr:beta-1,3-galactosyl-O-glycosyl-glycoprotein beta-1,6-N-acetylglucosaminyltransferase [Biomphalaria glabrata]
MPDIIRSWMHNNLRASSLIGGDLSKLSHAKDSENRFMETSGNCNYCCVKRISSRARLEEMRTLWQYQEVNCRNLFSGEESQRGHVTSSVNFEEERFLIAFSLMVYRDVEMVERLLRSIDRPQNYYCIYLDRKSRFLRAVSSIARCFQNVFVLPERVDVVWEGGGIQCLGAGDSLQEVTVEMEVEIFYQLDGPGVPAQD